MDKKDCELNEPLYTLNRISGLHMGNVRFLDKFDPSLSIEDHKCLFHLTVEYVSFLILSFIRQGILLFSLRRFFNSIIR